MRVVPRLLSAVAVGAVLLALPATRAVSCPFCSAPSQTMAEQVAQADGVCLVQWVEGRAASEQDPGNSAYDIVQVVKSPKGTVKTGDRITLARFRASKKGELFLLMGTRAAGGKGNAVEWGSPTEITEPAFNYVAQAPSPEVPAVKRLAYFVKFLEFPDQMVSNDAYAEFANAPYKDIAAVAPLLPRKKIREWITRPETSQPRLGLYGMLLGLCGTQDDAKLLAETISQKTDNFRIGIDGMISGYLLLTGPAGLDRIDEWKFKDAKVPFSETYAAMMGLRFMWQYAGGKIPNERLMQSMRILLNRPELADLVIADLARWNDWSVQDRLMELYGKGDYNIPSIKRAIVRFMLASTQPPQATTLASAANGSSAGSTSVQPAGTASGAQPAGGVSGSHSTSVASSGSSEAAERGKKYLEELRKKDPRTVKEAERFFFVN